MAVIRSNVIAVITNASFDLSILIKNTMGISSDLTRLRCQELLAIELANAGLFS